jgi:predicted TPR repeat methyltransferase
MSPGEILQLIRAASEHQRAGRLEATAANCRRVLTQAPNNSDALWILGITARNQGRLDEAAEMLRRWITQNPGNAEPHGMLGDIYRAQRKFDLAIEQYNAVIRLKPDLAAGYLNLGRALHAQGKMPQAIEAYQKSIRLKPEWAEAHDAHGNALIETGRVEEAIAALTTAVQLKPGLTTAEWGLGKIHVSHGRDSEALACYQRAAKVNPANANAHFFLGCRLIKADRPDEAAAEFREAIRLKPDSPDWKYQLAAITGDRSIKTAPSQYVRNLFDLYAPRFDQHLIEKLNYRMPSLLLEQVLQATAKREFDILDLGCGTGLCGVQFRPYARRLVGVDLSPEMIKRAESRNIYDQLGTGDLMTSLNAAVDQYDLILAGDVLVYVGDLSEFMPAAAKSLRTGGLLACSIEDYTGEGFILHPAERFAHSIEYFRRLALASGLKEVSADKVVLRKNKPVDVLGWRIVAEKA